MLATFPAPTSTNQILKGQNKAGKQKPWLVGQRLPINPLKNRVSCAE